MAYDDHEEFEDLKLTEESFIGEVYQSIGTIFFYLFGASLSMVISYSNNRSILWAIFHGLLSWGYVTYFTIFK